MLTLLLAFATAAPAQIDTAKVTGGTVSGTAQDGFTVFKGLPYAAPPLGTLRWQPPKPVRPWTGTRAAVEFGNACSQNPRMLAFFGDKTPVGEDCLTLNVWTGAKAATEKRPVMVWIYGGGFQGGTASLPLYDGAAFAKKGVVLVSLNYRTGAIGMLAHPELSREQGGRSGSYGLMDIVAALKWVRANIARFGGDEKNVTIFGQSGGAEAVGMLSYSPAARGLYDKAISESGANMKPHHRWETDYSLNQQLLPDMEAHGVDYLAKLGVKTIAEARALPAETVTAKMPEAHGPFWPDQDGLVQPADPMDLFAAGQFNDVPILVGSNSDDGGGSAQPSTPEKFEAWARTTFKGGADAILAAYPHATDAEASRSSDNIFRDNEYAWSTYQWARLQAEKGKAPVYTYYFDRKTDRTPNGARHGAEVSLVFGHPAGRDGTINPADAALSDQLMSYWINFAKTGNPNGRGLPSWPRFTAKTQSYMALGDKTGAIPVPNKPQLDALSAYYAWRKAQPESVRRVASVDEMRLRFQSPEDARARLVDCGVDARKVSVREDRELQEKVLRVANDATASVEQLECAAALTHDTGIHTVFGGKTDGRYWQAYAAQGQLLLEADALAWLADHDLLSKIVRFDQTLEAPAAAGRRVEQTCHAPEGFLIAHGDFLSPNLPTGAGVPALNHKVFICIMNVAQVTGLKIGFIGNEQYGR